ncbi:MAG TPA: tripartite tricarboxylate transporter TctB family protein [Burkholderiales bacterium]|jgi:hypothetical protein|nr:tripartite tricarboxylate transporter TctB family protein [Burkholderiales bacterium]
MNQQEDRPASSVRAMELVVAGLIFAVGALVVYDSVRLGNRWGDDGPQPGYFPFYVGLILCISSAITFGRGVMNRALSAETFVTRGQLKLVLFVLFPTVVYVAFIDWLGIYVTSIVFIAWFMRVLGKYSWVKSIAVPVIVMVAFFAVFEFWFKVPLPKGPLEALLHLN